MNEETIRDGLWSGRLHPQPLLQHLHKEGEDDLARFVAEEGRQYVQGTERLKFRSLVRELYPETLEAEDVKQRRRSQERYEARSRAVGEALKKHVADRREQRLSGPELPQGGGWQLPPGGPGR